MRDVAAVAMVLLIGAALAARLGGGLTRGERQLVWLSWLFHMVCSWALLLITSGIYGGGDTDAYGLAGGLLAGILWDDPVRYIPKVIALLFQQAPSLPVPVFGMGSSTGSMCAIAGLLMALLGGSFQAMSSAMALAAFVAKVTMYRALRDLFPQQLHLRVLAACTLIPTVAFWSAGIVKESVAVSGLCLLVACGRWIESRRFSRALVLGAAAAIVLGLVKPYTLFAFVAGAGAWLYARRSMARTGRLTVRPVYALVVAIGAVVGMVALGRVFPEFAVDTIAEGLARRQELWERKVSVSGSSYQIVDAPALTLIGQLAYAPFALFTALFRPVIFEVRNGLMAVNALETSLITVLFVRPVLRMGPSSLWNAIATRPFLAFCVVFACTFGIGVGLGTANLGTLSRYRMPLLPFFTMFVLAADSATRRVAARAPLSAGSLRR